MPNEVNADHDGLLTIREAAAWLRCSATNVYALIDSGELPYICVGNSKGYRIDRRDLEAFVDARKVAKPGVRRNGSPVRPKLKHIKF